MNNDQYSNIMLQLAKLEAKIEKLEEMLKPYAVTSVTVDPKGVSPEELSNFWNEATVRQFGHPIGE